MNNIKFISPFKRLCVTIGNLPTAYMESMSYYECITFLVKFLENEVIPTVNNNSEVVKELQDYVVHYFDNLDVQEEINNKLDEMAESGELADIIAQYLGLAGVLAYNTVNDLKEAENIVDGSICRTLGQSSYNDGKGAFYKIRTITAEDTVDELNIISLDISDTLIGERMFNILIDKCNPIYYGADPTGTIDSSTAIQKCLDANINKEITFTCGTYKIETPIEISYENKYGGINFNNSLIINETLNNYVIGVGTKNHALDHANSNNLTNRFYNISNLKMDTVSTYGILIDRWFMNCRLDNIDILTTKNGIQIGKVYDGYDNKPSDVQLTNFILTNTDMTTDYIGINIIGTDNKFCDGRIYGFKTGINANDNLVEINNIHFLACNFGENNLDNNYVCIKYPSMLMSDMCYCDSYPCFIKATDNNASLMITNLFVYSWHNQFTEASIFDFSEVSENTSVIDLSYKNIRISKGGYPATTKIIELSSNKTVNTSLLNGFNSQGNIRIAGINDLTDINKDLSQAKKGLFSNNYNTGWIANWIPIGYLNIINAGFAYLNIIDDSLGLISYKLRFDSNLAVTECVKISQANSGYDPAIGLKAISTGLYEICFAKNKSDLTVTTNVLNPAELIKNSSSYITTITKDLYNINATPESSVDIISS